MRGYVTAKGRQWYAVVEPTRCCGDPECAVDQFRADDARQVDRRSHLRPATLDAMCGATR